jgi:hypothetical protein
VNGDGDRPEPRVTWIRRPPDRGERLQAGAMAVATAAAVGGVVYYLARTLLARDRIALRPEDEGRRE